MIIRHPHENGYTVVHNATLNDSRLSWKARGLLAYLLSKPDGWRVIVAALVKEAPGGRDAVLSGLKELETHGYLTRNGPTRGNDGTFDGTECEIREVPETPACTANGLSGHGLSGHGLPAVGKSDTNKEPIQQVMTVESNEVENPRETAFNRIWEVYPRKLNRKEALECFIARCNQGVSVQDLETATSHYAASVQGVEQKVIMYGTTFFGVHDRWRDYLDAPHPEQHVPIVKPRPGESKSRPIDELLANIATRDRKERRRLNP